MLRVEASTTIKRPIDEVFAVASDSANRPKWVSGVVEFAKTSDGPIGVGTTWHGVGKFMGRRIESDAVYTVFQANRKFTMDGTKPFPTMMAFTFESVADGTRVDLTVDAEPGGLYRLLGPLLASGAKRQFQSDLDNLKDLMNGGRL